MSDIVWSEYFAENTAGKGAAPESREEVFPTFEPMTLSLLRGIRREVEEAIREWVMDRDTRQLWDRVIVLEAVFNQLGRCLGLLDAFDDSEHRSLQFCGKVEAEWTGWARVTWRLRECLRRVAREGRCSLPLPELDLAIQNGFRCAGVNPGIRHDGRFFLGVDDRWLDK